MQPRSAMSSWLYPNFASEGCIPVRYTQWTAHYLKLVRLTTLHIRATSFVIDIMDLVIRPVANVAVKRGRDVATQSDMSTACAFKLLQRIRTGLLERFMPSGSVRGEVQQ